MTALAVAIALAAVFALARPSESQAHQSGCHRWHSCPSDSGSYVCGDLGYTSGCPGSTPTSPPASPPSAPSIVGPADGQTFTVGQGSGTTFTVLSSEGSPSIRIARAGDVDASGILTGNLYPVTLLPVGDGTYTGMLPWLVFTSGLYPDFTPGTFYWQTFIYSAAACATSACYVVGPVQSFTVAAAAAPPAATTPAAPASTSSPLGPKESSACAEDKRRRKRLVAQIKRLRRQIASASAKKRPRLRRQLKRRRAQLSYVRDDIAVDC